MFCGCHVWGALQCSVDTGVFHGCHVWRALQCSVDTGVFRGCHGSLYVVLTSAVESQMSRWRPVKTPRAQSGQGEGKQRSQPSDSRGTCQDRCAQALGSHCGSFPLGPPGQGFALPGAPRAFRDVDRVLHGSNSLRVGQLLPFSNMQTRTQGGQVTCLRSHAVRGGRSRIPNP